jgi:gas vesicle protein
MADGYDRYDNEGGGGGSFVMGLLTGTVLGAGLGMLFAPKSGSELRNQLSEQAGTLRDTASEGYRRASEAAGDLAEKGRGVVDKARRGGARRRRSAALRARSDRFQQHRVDQRLWRRQRQRRGIVRVVWFDGLERIQRQQLYQRQSAG